MVLQNVQVHLISATHHSDTNKSSNSNCTQTGVTTVFKDIHTLSANIRWPNQSTSGQSENESIKTGHTLNN